MSPVVLIVAAGAAIWALASGKPKQKSTLRTEAPKDAQNLFAAILSPSIQIDGLTNAYNTFLAAAKNLPDGTAAQVRLGLYALVCYLKGLMLSRGAQADPDEMLMIGNAPIAGGIGLISYGDATIDQMTAAATALAPGYNDADGVGTYIKAIAGAMVAAKTTEQAGKRLTAFLLALKAKQMCLLNPLGVPAQFAEIEKLPPELPQVFFAIANIPAADVIVVKPNSILAYG